MPTSVLLSIRPHYADAILSGCKKFEFRRQLFKNRMVDRILIYATKPVGMVVGEFLVDGIIEADPEELWSLTRSHAGVGRETFDEYFADCSVAYAIKVGVVTRYAVPRNLQQTLNVQHPPQSFRYIPPQLMQASF